MRAALLLATLLLAACGQAGDLYLPDKTSPPQTAPAPVPATAPDATQDKKDKR